MSGPRWWPSWGSAACRPRPGCATRARPRRCRRPAGRLSYNTLLAAVARGEGREVVDTPVGWVLAQAVAAGHVLAFERGVPGSRYALCGEVASFPRVLNGYAELVGSEHRVTGLPP